MKIKGLLIIVICMIGLSGCTSKGFDIERVYQFVEIQSSNGKEIGTIVNSDDLEFFFEEMKFQEWKYIEEKEDFGKCIYKFIAYEFVKDDESNIRGRSKETTIQCEKLSDIFRTLYSFYDNRIVPKWINLFGRFVFLKDTM